MAEQVLPKAPETPKSSTTTVSDVMNKFADDLSQKKEQAKQAKQAEVKVEAKPEPITEAPVAEAPKVEATKAEPAKAEPAKAEAPKEPTSNGESENPKKELENPITTKPETVKPAEEGDWRKELGFDSSTEKKTEEVKKEDNSKLLNEYESKAKEYDADSNDIFISAYKAAKKAGKDPISFMNEVKGVDINALTAEQVWDANLKAEGLSAEEITTEMEKFGELSPFEKKQAIKPFKQELISQQQENLKKYASETVSTEQSREALAEVAQKEAKTFFGKIKDKEWQGMKMTPSEVNKLENFLEKEFKFRNADGTVNYELYAKVGNYALNERTILQNTYKKGETRGYEKALLEIARPSANDKKFNAAPEVKTNNKSEQAKIAAKEAFNPA